MSNQEAIAGLVGSIIGTVAGFVFGSTYNLAGAFILALLGGAVGWTVGRIPWH
jgi:ABC-type lipoprotein release transport system permease subunit